MTDKLPSFASSTFHSILLPISELFLPIFENLRIVWNVDRTTDVTESFRQLIWWFEQRLHTFSKLQNSISNSSSLCRDYKDPPNSIKWEVKRPHYPQWSQKPHEKIQECEQTRESHASFLQREDKNMNVSQCSHFSQSVKINQTSRSSSLNLTKVLFQAYRPSKNVWHVQVHRVIFPLFSDT